MQIAWRERKTQIQSSLNDTADMMQERKQSKKCQDSAISQGNLFQSPCKNKEKHIGHVTLTKKSKETRKSNGVKIKK